MIKMGVEYLLAYKITVPIYDYTVIFCERHVSKFSRTDDQTCPPAGRWTQAARSGLANIVEGYKQKSLSGYIKLTGVARGSLEELLQDYYAFIRQRGIILWTPSEGRERREIRAIWEVLTSTPTLPSQPSFPSLPHSPDLSANILITLIKQANYLLDKLIISLEEKHMKEGGFNENLFRKRKEYLSSRK